MCLIRSHAIKEYRTLVCSQKILELVPGTNVDAIERCSGHDGTYGVKSETHKIAIK